MSKAQIVYNSRDEYYKYPAGAVTADTLLTFRIGVARELGPLAIRMIVKYDRHDAPAIYEMHQSPKVASAMDADPCASGASNADRGEDYLEYTVSFEIHDTGLYWYHFEVQTATELLRVGKNTGDLSDRGATEDYDATGSKPADGSFSARAGSGRAIISEDPCAWQQTVYRRAYDAPEWIYGGIYYHVFVDRFNKSRRPGQREEAELAIGERTLHDNWGDAPDWKPVNGKIYNNDFFGGDLNGIREKLPYLASLNVSCIYLSPIFEAYSSHKYDTGDYEHVDPMFGTEEDFRILCEEANEHGIRVICDGVFAHTGSDSKYFDKYEHYANRAADAGDEIVPGAYRHPESPYRSWYFFHEDETYDCWWDFNTLPKVNKRDPGYVAYITGENGIVRRWLRAGASGWRLDVADELPNDFIDSLVSAAKAEKTDSLILGEVWEDASNKIAYEERKNYFEGGRLDAVMNYPFRTGIIDFVRYGNAEGLAETVESICENYPPEVLHCLMNVLGTHDSVRIITALAGEEFDYDPPRFLQMNTHLSEEEWTRGIRFLKIASLLQMTLPGVPCIYYGDEAGTEGYKDPFNRTCYPWGHENEELLSWYRKITRIRTDHSVYRTGGYRTLLARDGCYAFERFGEASDPTGNHAGAGSFAAATHQSALDAPAMITAANCGTREQTLTLQGIWRDLLQGSIYEGTITLFPGDTLLLKQV